MQKTLQKTMFLESKRFNQEFNDQWPSLPKLTPYLKRG
jgi:hypothetical protein